MIFDRWNFRLKNLFVHNLLVSFLLQNRMSLVKFLVWNLNTIILSILRLIFANIFLFSHFFGNYNTKVCHIFKKWVVIFYNFEFATACNSLSFVKIAFAYPFCIYKAYSTFLTKLIFKWNLSIFHWKCIISVFFWLNFLNFFLIINFFKTWL